MTLAFASSPRFAEHDTGPHHPERPDRLRAIYRALYLSKLVPTDPFPDFPLHLGPVRQFEKPLLQLPFQHADLKWIHEIHPARYVDRVRFVSEVGGVLDQGDTPTCIDSFDIALYGVGALLSCCDAVVKGTTKRAFAAIRPPGHHAEPDRPMGFCLFANVAIAAKYLQRQHGVGKIAIVDFDVHHGNGTQACFYQDPSVFYVSLHESPRTCYPGTGFDFEMGLGGAKGTNLNIPFDPGASDPEYLAAMDEKVLPALDQFKPEVLLISAGFDAHREDPLAHVDLTEDAFEQITRKLVSVADAHCRGRVVSALEGGYNLRALGRSVLRHLAGMM